MTLLERHEHLMKTDPEYRARHEGLKRMWKRVDRIKTFAVLERGWPVKEAEQLACDMVCPTLRRLA